MKYILIFIPLIALYSCDIMRLLNTSKQKDETTEEISVFLNKHKFIYDYSFSNIDSTSNLLTDSIYKLDKKSAIYSFIQLRIYDTSGKLYSGYSQCMGNFNSRKFIDSLPPLKNSYPYLNSELEFKDELNLISISPETKMQVLQEYQRYDYIFVVYWTIWTNYFSKHVLREVSKIKSEEPDRVFVIFVNLAKEK